MAKQEPDLRELINLIIACLRRHHPEICRHWFDEIEVVGVEGGVLRLLVSEPVQLRYLQRSAVQAFTEAVQMVTGRLLAVRFVGERSPSSASQSLPTRASSGTTGAGDAGSGDSPVSLDDQMVLIPDFSFDNFVVGPGNRLAHAAAVAVAAKLGRAYNPFFVHGGVGLGKTHLLQAICQAVLKANPSARITYISCNTFMDAFHDCVKLGRMMEFRHRFRNVDMLVIDDIHFLSKREQTQEEFFHTFNSLHQAGRQIVLSSDAAPGEIPDLEERLISRFNSGLVARVDRPCYETRVAIVKTKASLHDMKLPEDVPAYIAARVDSNIRELEGALARLRALAQALGKPIDLELAKQAFSDHDQQQSGNPSPSIQTIIEAVTAYYNVKLTDLLGKRRHKSIALPRQVAMWLARKHTRYSLEEIGGHLGGRDHSTVLHAVRVVEGKRNRDQSMSSDVSRLERSIGTRE